MLQKKFKSGWGILALLGILIHGASSFGFTDEQIAQIAAALPRLERPLALFNHVPQEIVRSIVTSDTYQPFGWADQRMAEHLPPGTVRIVRHLPSGTRVYDRQVVERILGREITWKEVKELSKQIPFVYQGEGISFFDLNFQGTRVTLANQDLMNGNYPGIANYNLQEQFSIIGLEESRFSTTILALTSPPSANEFPLPRQTVRRSPPSQAVVDHLATLAQNDGEHRDEALATLRSIHTRYAISPSDAVRTQLLNHLTDQPKLDKAAAGYAFQLLKENPKSLWNFILRRGASGFTDDARSFLIDSIVRDFQANTRNRDQAIRVLYALNLSAKSEGMLRMKIGNLTEWEQRSIHEIFQRRQTLGESLLHAVVRYNDLRRVQLVLRFWPWHWKRNEFSEEDIRSLLDFVGDVAARGNVALLRTVLSTIKHYVQPQISNFIDSNTIFSAVAHKGPKAIQTILDYMGETGNQWWPHYSDWRHILKTILSKPNSSGAADRFAKIRGWDFSRNQRNTAEILELAVQAGHHSFIERILKAPNGIGNGPGGDRSLGREDQGNRILRMAICSKNVDDALFDLLLRTHWNPPTSLIPFIVRFGSVEKLQVLLEYRGRQSELDQALAIAEAAQNTRMVESLVKHGARRSMRSSFRYMCGKVLEFLGS